ncbi:hypothetical protein AGOR_G00047160 [Albula goreensis]|uniref:Hyaluronan/mRNA-binding protein domain-containing protein n=1 Tax=Albula goreensis TaxID=1534307 RepID=A0A8T3DT29_9TELE|nr:hypothetical protein AGOR_G00047160 [Albula goreensis]
MQQDSFGCAVMNRFDRLLDDEADPFDILREAELEKQKKKKKAELKKGSTAKHGKKESQKDRKVPNVGDGGVGHIRNAAGRRRAPRGGHVQNENSCAVEPERDERRVVFRERRPNQMEAPPQYSVEAYQDRWNKGGRGRGWGRGIGEGWYPRNTDSFVQRPRKEFDQSGGTDQSDLLGCTPDQDVKEGQEAVETDKPNVVADGEAEVEAEPPGAAEMSLDEWKALLEQSRPKQELKLRKPDTRVPSKALVIHQSKHLEVQGEGLSEEEDSHFFRRPANDITASLVFNFGSLPRPSRGGRGGRGGRGRGGPISQPERVPVQAEMVQAPNPDDPEDFPALV